MLDILCSRQARLVKRVFMRKPSLKLDAHSVFYVGFQIKRLTCSTAAGPALSSLHQALVNLIRKNVQLLR